MAASWGEVEETIGWVRPLRGEEVWRPRTAARQLGVHGRDNVRADFSRDVIVGRLAEVYRRVQRR